MNLITASFDLATTGFLARQVVLKSSFGEHWQDVAVRQDSAMKGFVDSVLGSSFAIVIKSSKDVHKHSILNLAPFGQIDLASSRTVSLRTVLSRQRFSFDLELLATAGAVKKASNPSFESKLAKRSLNSIVAITTTIVITAAESIAAFDTCFLVTFDLVCLSLARRLWKYLSAP